jgi:hypothetical protein
LDYRNPRNSGAYSSILLCRRCHSSIRPESSQSRVGSVFVTPVSGKGHVPQPKAADAQSCKLIVIVSFVIFAIFLSVRPCFINIGKL